MFHLLGVRDDSGKIVACIVHEDDNWTEAVEAINPNVRLRDCLSLGCFKTEQEAKEFANARSE